MYKKTVSLLPNCI